MKYALTSDGLFPYKYKCKTHLINIFRHVWKTIKNEDVIKIINIPYFKKIEWHIIKFNDKYYLEAFIEINNKIKKVLK